IQGKSLNELKNLSKQHVFDLLGIEVGPVRIKCALLPLKAVKTAVYTYLGIKMDSKEFEG
ncbi:MAG: Fe-S cluster protein, partial [Candidatus Caldarchaeum sp.]